MRENARRHWRSAGSISRTQPAAFAGRQLTVEGKRRNYGERRLQTVGFLAGRMVMVVWTVK